MHSRFGASFFGSISFGADEAVTDSAWFRPLVSDVTVPFTVGFARSAEGCWCDCVRCCCAMISCFVFVLLSLSTMFIDSCSANSSVNAQVWEVDETYLAGCLDRMVYPPCPHLAGLMAARLLLQSTVRVGCLGRMVDPLCRRLECQILAPCLTAHCRGPFLVLS